MADEEMDSLEQSNVGEASLDTDTQTPSQEKRWNLRRRKPAQKVSEEPSEGEDDTITASPPPPTKKRKTESKTAAKRKPRKPTAPVVEVGRGEGGAVEVGGGGAVEMGGGEGGAEAALLLYEMVLGGSSAAKSVASEWVDRYEQDAESAMLELVQYFILCCGCKAVVTMAMFQDDNTSAIIRTLTENFAEESGDYPLILSGPTYKKFKANFCDVLEHIIEQCQHGILFDEYMLDTLIVWLVGFTDSQVRAFRHTCTLACVKLVSALIFIANSVSTELDNTQRQVEAERKRQQARKEDQNKLKKLIVKKTELLRKKSELEETMRGLVSSVFVHRYRDVRPEIRALCISELGQWLVNYSAYFLEDMYLKYIGWVMHDKNAEVRLASVQVLETLYASETTAPHMELFTERFKERMLSMRLDRDDNVALHAIRLLGFLLNLDMLEQEDCVEVCELVFFENRFVSLAAGKFAAMYLFSEDFMMRAKQTKVPRKHRKPTDTEIMLAELIKFFIDVKIHDHATYFVDSLWEHVPVLKEWEAMCSLLLDDKSGLVLNSEEERVLVEVMACAVRRSVATTHPPGRGKARVLSAKDKRTIEENRENFSVCLMSSLPQLMAKFGSDAEVAANLVSIPQHFDLELFAEHRLQKHLDALLTQLQTLMLAHHKSEVLDECAQTYLFLTDSEFSLHSTTDMAFQQLLDELTASFKHQLSECKEHLSDEDEVFELTAVLGRLTCFARYTDLSKWELVEEMRSLMQTGLSKECSDKVLCSAVVFLRLDVLWALHGITEDSPDRDAMRSVLARLKQLVKDCQELVKFGRGETSQREAYVTLCDLLIAFGRQLRQRGQLGGLVFAADARLQQALLDYVLESVMVEEEEIEPTSEEAALEQAEKLNDRRVLLSAFLKLAMFSAVDMTLTAPVFARYLSQYHNFGDLLKTALSRCREACSMSWAKTVILSLKELFLDVVTDGEVDQTSVQWADLRDLARRFALTTGFDIHKVRQPLVALQREGIVFALSEQQDDPLVAPPNLDFLLVLSEFTFRLLLVDKKSVFAYLSALLPDKRYECVERLADWESLRCYCSNLQPREDAVRGRGRPNTTQQTAKGKRKVGVVDEEGWLSRPTKTARLNSSSSDVGSEVSGSPPVTKTAKAKGK